MFVGTALVSNARTLSKSPPHAAFFSSHYQQSAVHDSTTTSIVLNAANVLKQIVPRNAL